MANFLKIMNKRMVLLNPKFMNKQQEQEQMDGEGNPGSGENIGMIDQQQEDGMQQEMG